MRQWKSLVVAAGLISLVTACGDDNKSVGDAIDEKVNELQLNDRWNSSCRNVVLDLFNLSSEVAQYYFAIDGGLARTTTYYGEDNCAVPVLKVEENGKYGMGDELAPDAYAIDLNFETVGITPINEDGVNTLNLLNACGFSDWAVGQKKEVTAQSDNNPLSRCWAKTPATTYDLVQVSGDNLKFGLREGDKDKSRAEGRPTQIDQGTIYTRE